jgi:hypothetical protein
VTTIRALKTQLKMPLLLIRPVAGVGGYLTDSRELNESGNFICACEVRTFKIKYQCLEVNP